MEKKSEEKRQRKSTRKIKNLTLEDYEKTGVRQEMTELERRELTNGVIYGWQCINQVANDIWGSIHSCLLKGDLVFAYKSPKEGDKLKQIVIVRNFDMIETPTGPQKSYRSYGVGYITPGYTALLPNVPYEYISGEIVDYLNEWKVDKTIINTYEAIVEELGK